MKKIKILPVIILLTFFINTQAQYKVSTWYQQKEAAVTYTFDGYDNTGSKQLSVAVPLFDTYGYKVTITTIIEWIDDWSGLKSAAANGHEIASLTITHNSLADETDSVQEYELSESQRIINENIPNASCLTLAFPYCETGNMDLVEKYYICGRICSGVIEPSTPSDLYQISSIITGEEGSVYLADHLNAKVESARSSNGWCVFLIHGIDGDGGYSSIASRHIKSHLAYMNENDSVYWIGTFLDVVKYIRERNAAQFTEETITSDSLRVTITDGLEDSIYYHPLTIERSLPTGWASAKVYQGQSQVSSTVERTDTDTTLVFEAIPDGGDVFIAKNGSLVDIPPTLQKSDLQIYPNPFKNGLTITLDGKYTYEIYSLNGKLMEKGNGQNTSTIGKKLPAGSYLLQTTVNGEKQSTRIIKTQ